MARGSTNQADESSDASGAGSQVGDASLEFLGSEAIDEGELLEFLASDLDPIPVDPVFREQLREVTPGGNWGSFIRAVRAGDPSMANGNVLDAHYGCVLGHLINNSYRLGEQMPFNAKAGRFGDNSEAFEHFMRLHGTLTEGVGMPEDQDTYTVGPWLSFDPESERFMGDHASDANALLKDSNREGFEVPAVGKV